MRKIIGLAVLLLFISFLIRWGVNLVFPRNESRTNWVYSPQWRKGDSWIVRTWYGKGAIHGDKRDRFFVNKAIPIDVYFQVVDVKTFKKEVCYQIQVTFPKDERGFQRRWILYIRQDDLTLKRIVNNSIKSDGSFVNIWYDFPKGPVLADNVESLIPFDFPLFSQKKILFQDEARAREVKQEAFFLTIKLRDRIQRVIQFTISTKKDDTVIKAVQKWQYGKPWWSEAKRFKDGKIIAEAILVEFPERNKE
jgi:hypothetical protein